MHLNARRMHQALEVLGDGPHNGLQVLLAVGILLPRDHLEKRVPSGSLFLEVHVAVASESIEPCHVICSRILIERPLQGVT